ncbi:Cell wall mannoprotein, partial [Lachnellula suecica]
MRFNILPVAFLATTVLADGASIAAAIAAIQNATTALGTTVASFPAGLLGLTEVLPLLVDSTKLLLVINTGTQTASSSANLTDAEAIGIVAPTQALASAVNSTLTSVIAAKAKFDPLVIISPTILLNLELEKSASDKFGTAVVGKVPAALQAIAESLLVPIDDAFTEAIA